LGATAFGTAPPNNQPKETTFFRLWNGILRVQDFTNNQLPNQVGIFLHFEAPFTGSRYVPGDYWTFEVRAGEIGNDTSLVGKDLGAGNFLRVPPKGIHYHRVSLAILSWVSTTAVLTPIEDCRHLFQPLTRLATCCTYRVGDGLDSWGDFEKIQDAVDHLPLEGGEICVLPGKYVENVTIDSRQNITINRVSVHEYA